MIVSICQAPRALPRIVATIAVLASPVAAAADTVILKSYDGSAEMQGDLLGYTDGIFTLGTPLGEIYVPAQLAACDGAACPNARTVIQDLQAAGSMMRNDGLMQDASAPEYCPLTGALLNS